MTRFFALLLALTSTVVSAQSNGTLSDQRRNLQSQFSVCQSKLYAAPDKAPPEAHQAMEQFIAELMKFRDEALPYATARYQTWNNESYWYYVGTSGRRYSYWTSGPSARMAVDKLGVQLDKIRAAQLPAAGPYDRTHLNQTQQLLDGLRNALSLDAEIEQMVRQYLRR